MNKITKHKDLVNSMFDLDENKEILGENYQEVKALSDKMYSELEYFLNDLPGNLSNLRKVIEYLNENKSEGVVQLLGLENSLERIHDILT